MSDERYDEKEFDRRRDAMRALSPELRRTMVEYINTATGWLYVAGGGFLIALEETWELREAYA